MDRGRSLASIRTKAFKSFSRHLTESRTAGFWCSTREGKLSALVGILLAALSESLRLTGYSTSLSPRIAPVKVRGNVRRMPVVLVRVVIAYEHFDAGIGAKKVVENLEADL